MSAKVRPPVLRIFKDEKIIDLFAGGGGVSTGIGWALGRDPDVAVNHNAEAIAMHAANHPSTKHYVSDVFEVDPLEACGLKRPWSMAQTLGGEFKVGLFRMSPDCTFHSKARGAKPHRHRNPARRRRGLAGVGLKWARIVRPRLIGMENVEEFEEWGPLKWCETKVGWVPDEARAGESFLKFIAELRNLGYDVEWRQLKACDFGAPTTRKRFYLLARCDGKPIAWPEPTHGAPPLPLPYRTAAECIDWSIPCPSIFMTKAEAREWKERYGVDVHRPLSPKTLRRVAAGVDRYVLKSKKPFIIDKGAFVMPVNHGVSDFDGDGLGRSRSVGKPIGTVTAAPRGEYAVVTPLIARIGQTGGNGAYVNDVRTPLTTVTTKAEHFLVEAKMERAAAFLAAMDEPMAIITSVDPHSLVTAHVVNLKGSMDDRQSSSQDLRDPVPTICANGNHLAEVRAVLEKADDVDPLLGRAHEVYAFLTAYYGTLQDPQITKPMHTLTTKDRMALVTVVIDGERYAIVDICMRMLTPRELFLAMGFPPGYVIDPVVETKVRRGKKVVVLRKKLTKTSQVHMCGNAVCPPMAEALLVANFTECDDDRLEAAA